jgi:transposase
MLIKTLLNKCHKLKSFVYEKVQIKKYYGKEVLETEILPRKNSHPICSVCETPGPIYDTSSKKRRFEFIPIWGYPVYFLYKMRRVNCHVCNRVVTEKVPWASGKITLTNTYMAFLSRWSKILSWREVAKQFRTSWDKVFQSAEYIVKWGLKKRSMENITAIGVDEVQWHCGHKYLTLVYQIDSHAKRLLWIAKDRTEETFNGFFDELGEVKSKAIKFICSDMWRPYLNVIKERVSQAVHILDRFHIVSMLNKAIDEVRAGEYKQMSADGYEPILRKSRWCLLKRRENLTEKQEVKLKDLLKYNLKSVRAYLLKEDFQGFWEYISPAWAGKFLKRWCTRVMRSKIEPLKKVAKSIRKHQDLILNWFKAKKAFSSGIVEGFNTKVKLTIRKSYGFRTFKATEIALYHALGDLPEPEFAHEFY